MALTNRLRKLEATSRSRPKPMADLSRMTDDQLYFLERALDPEAGIGLEAAFASLSPEELAAFEAAIAPTCT
jgi:hypothetical protein